MELDKLPKLNEEIERKSPRRLVEFDAFENACLNIHFSTNQVQIELNEKNKIELKTNNHPRYGKTGPYCLYCKCGENRLHIDVFFGPKAENRLFLTFWAAKQTEAHSRNATRNIVKTKQYDG